MSRDDVLRMAREAGIPNDNIPRLCHGRLETGVESLKRFAALVASAEREACAKVAQDWSTAMTDKLAAAIRARSAP